MAQALGMPLAERRSRHEAVFATICEYDVNQWQRESLKALEGRRQERTGFPTLRARCRTHKPDGWRAFIRAHFAVDRIAPPDVAGHSNYGRVPLGAAHSALSGSAGWRCDNMAV